MRLPILLLAQLGVVAQVDAKDAAAADCACGEECTTIGGGSGVCGQDGQCAVFLAEPDCGTTTAKPICPGGCSGMAMRAPNFFCDDGSLAGPVCDEPDCEWHYRTCPSFSSSSTVSTTQPSCASGCSGEPMDAPNFFCDDGSLAGPVCDEPDCAWHYRTCPVHADCPCGKACTMQDGSGGQGLCGADGVCAVFVQAPECPTTTTAAAVCPHGCPGPAPMAPNYQCPDGSIGGPVCAPPTCHWAIRTCPSIQDDADAASSSSSSATTDTAEPPSSTADEGHTTATTVAEETGVTTDHHVTSAASCPHGCPPPAPGMPNYQCPDGSVGGPVCAPPSCQWSIRDCPSPPVLDPSDGAAVAAVAAAPLLLLVVSAAAAILTTAR